MISIIGCGNANRMDDAAGLEVVKALKHRQTLNSRSDVRLLDAGTDGMAVMFAAQGSTTLIVVDGCCSGAEPGTIFEVPGRAVESQFTPTLNLHDFRWDHAIYAGRRIFRDSFPDDVTAYLIEVGALDFGLELTPAVQRSVAVVAQRIEARIGAGLESGQSAERTP